MKNLFSNTLIVVFFFFCSFNSSRAQDVINVFNSGVFLHIVDQSTEKDELRKGLALSHFPRNEEYKNVNPQFLGLNNENSLHRTSSPLFRRSNQLLENGLSSMGSAFPDTEEKIRRGFLIKISPWHFFQAELRLGLELKLNSTSTLEVEGGIQGLLNEEQLVNNYNAIIRYKLFGILSKMEFSDNFIEGTYVAPLFNYGTSVQNYFIETVASDPDLSIVNEYALVGADLGIQSQYGHFNFDFFIGAGFSFLPAKEEFKYKGEKVSIVFNNSHTSFGKVGLRMGFRVGIDPFNNKN